MMQDPDEAKHLFSDGIKETSRMNNEADRHDSGDEDRGHDMKALM